MPLALFIEKCKYFGIRGVLRKYSEKKWPLSTTASLVDNFEEDLIEAGSWRSRECGMTLYRLCVRCL